MPPPETHNKFHLQCSILFHLASVPGIAPPYSGPQARLTVTNHPVTQPGSQASCCHPLDPWYGWVMAVAATPASLIGLLPTTLGLCHLWKACPTTVPTADSTRPWFSPCWCLGFPEDSAWPLRLLRALRSFARPQVLHMSLSGLEVLLKSLLFFEKLISHTWQPRWGSPISLCRLPWECKWGSASWCLATFLHPPFCL